MLYKFRASFGFRVEGLQLLRLRTVEFLGSGGGL